MNSPAARALLYVPLIAFALGAAGGGWVGLRMAPEPEQEQEPALSPFKEREREKLGLFEVSHAARDSLKLRVGPAATRPLVEHVRMPAFVRELSAVSDLVVASRLEGVVSRVFVRQGQAVREGDPICELTLTGDALASTQAALLKAVQQLAIIDEEIGRLERAGAGGGTAGLRLIDQQYERKRVAAELETRRQELLVRGLAADQVAQVLEQRLLVRSAVVRVPAGLVDGDPADNLTPEAPLSTARATPRSAAGVVGASSEPDLFKFSVETLQVSPGTLVSTGDVVADLAYHELLTLEGQAFDRDLELIRQAADARRPLAAELGASESPIRIDNLQLHYLDNHLEPESKSYRLYVPLANHVAHETVDAAGRRYRSWQFKPGQRGHVLLPTRTWTDQIPLPADAVVRDGVDWYVFRKHATHAEEDVPHDDFAPVRVVVLVEGTDEVLVSADSLPAGTPIAMNQAYRLLLAMKDEQSGGGADAHHGHNH